MGNWSWQSRQLCKISTSKCPIGVCITKVLTPYQASISVGETCLCCSPSYNDSWCDMFARVSLLWFSLHNHGSSICLICNCALGTPVVYTVIDIGSLGSSVVCVKYSLVLMGSLMFCLSLHHHAAIGSPTSQLQGLEWTVVMVSSFLWSLWPLLC